MSALFKFRGGGIKSSSKKEAAMVVITVGEKEIKVSGKKAAKEVKKEVKKAAKVGSELLKEAGAFLKEMGIPTIKISIK